MEKVLFSLCVCIQLSLLLFHFHQHLFGYLYAVLLIDSGSTKAVCKDSFHFKPSL